MVTLWEDVFAVWIHPIVVVVVVVVGCQKSKHIRILSNRQFISQQHQTFIITLWVGRGISFSTTRIYFSTPKEFRFHPADADLSKLTFLLPAIVIHGTAAHYLTAECSYSSSSSSSSSSSECLIRPLSTTPRAGNKMVSWWMWSMPILHWWARGWLRLYRFRHVEYNDVTKLCSQQIKCQSRREKGVFNRDDRQ